MRSFLVRKINNFTKRYLYALKRRILMAHDCILYTIHYTVYSIHYTYAVYNIHYTVCTIHSEHTKHYTVYTI